MAGSPGHCGSSSKAAPIRSAARVRSAESGGQRGEAAFRDPHRPDVDRPGALHPGRGTDSQLGGAAADVQDRVPSREVEPESGAREGVAGLLLAAQLGQFDPRAPRHDIDELVAVGRVPQGRGPEGADAAGAEPFGAAAVPGEESADPIDGGGSDAALGVDALSETGDGVGVVEDVGFASGARPPRDHQDGVGSEVDGGLHPGGGAAHGSAQRSRLLSRAVSSDGVWHCSMASRVSSACISEAICPRTGM